VPAPIVRGRPPAETVGVHVPRVLAPVAAASSLVVAAGAIVLGEVAARSGVAELDRAQASVFALAVAAPVGVGLVLAWRGVAPSIAWVLLLGALGVSLAGAAQPYAEVALLARPGSLPDGQWAAVVSDAAWPFFFAWPLALAFLFPDGRLVSRAWRPVVVAAAGSIVLLVVVIALTEQRLGSPFHGFRSPAPPALERLGVLRAPLVLVLFASLFAGAVSVRARARRARGIERLQLRAFVWVAALIPLGFGFCLIWGLVVGGGERVVFVVVLMLEAAAAVAVGLAVSRYRLYELDRLINRTLVYGLVTLVLGAVYAGIAFGLGVLAGHGSTWITAAATLGAAATFRPLLTRARSIVDWRFDRARFDGLRRVAAFEADVREGRAVPEQLERLLAEVLHDPTVRLLFWLPASEVYADAEGTVVTVPNGGCERTEAVLHGAPLALLLHDPVMPERRDLLNGVLGAASLSIEVARLRVEVKAQLAQVAASRGRIIEAGYEERRRLERDLHDGAQQRLVSLGIQLRRMQRSLPNEALVLAAPLDTAVVEIGKAIADLRHIAAGVRPARLDDGLAPALEDLARGAPVAVRIEATTDRLPPSVESAAFFVACEALTNAIKHADATRVEVTAVREDDTLILTVRDDGKGGAVAGGGSGLVGLADRVDAHGGRLRIASARGEGTLVEVELPCAL
jgi:signal transduction histidine kinase